MKQTIELLTRKIAADLLSTYGDHDVALHRAWELMEHATNMNRAQLLMNRNLQLSDAQRADLNRWVDEITIEHKPIHYILGTVPFLNTIITVRPPTLIPRPETEEWCALLIDQLRQRSTPPRTILDLCTGSGCIALALAKAFPCATVIASDIASEALTLARENAQRNDIANVTFLQSDLYAALPKQTFDLIVANPPYIAPEEYVTLDPSVMDWEDSRALVAQDHGLAIIHEIVEHAAEFLHLAPDNFPQLWIEIGYQQGSAVSTIFERHNFIPHLLKDASGNDRVVTGAKH